MALGANELLLELKVKKAILERMELTVLMELMELTADLDQWLDMVNGNPVHNIIVEMTIETDTILLRIMKNIIYVKRLLILLFLEQILCIG